MRTDFRPVVYVGLDVASIMGVAVARKADLNTAGIGLCKGGPQEQLEYLFDEVLSPLLRNDEEIILVMERLHHFKNAKTVRSLSERYGYLKYTLLSFNFQVREVGATEARKALGTHNKESTFMRFVPAYKGNKMLCSDHTDALALVVWAALEDNPSANFDALKVYDLEKEKQYGQ